MSCEPATIDRCRRCTRTMWRQGVTEIGMATGDNAWGLTVLLKKCPPFRDGNVAASPTKGYHVQLKGQFIPEDQPSWRWVQLVFLHRMFVEKWFYQKVMLLEAGSRLQSCAKWFLPSLCHRKRLMLAKSASLLAVVALCRLYSYLRSRWMDPQLSVKTMAGQLGWRKWQPTHEICWCKTARLMFTSAVKSRIHLRWFLKSEGTPQSSSEPLVMAGFGWLC